MSQNKHLTVESDMKKTRLRWDKTRRNEKVIGQEDDMMDRAHVFLHPLRYIFIIFLQLRLK